MLNSNHKRNRRNNNPFEIQEGLINDVSPSSRYKLEWDGDSIIGKKTKGESVGRNFNFNKIWILKIVCFLFIFSLFLRMFWLQVVNGEKYKEIADGNRIRIRSIEARRGIIYDKDLNPLVHNVANFLVYFIPSDLPDGEKDKKKILNRLVEILGDITIEEIEEKLSAIEPRSLDIYQPLFIDDNIEYEKAMLIHLEAESMPGVILTNKNRRQYTLPTMSLSHILGYSGKISVRELEASGSEYSQIDYIGKTGIEYFWESELRGSNGKKQVEVDALGKEKKIISQSPVLNGYNLVLSIDTQAQVKLEEILKRKLEEMGLGKAVGIVMNPNNGEIISLVNLPSYNNNVFARGITQKEYTNLIEHPDNPLFMRAVSGEYPSGSTIKPLVVTAALEEGVVTEYTSFFSTGGIRIGQWFFPDWKAGGHGSTNARKAIAESVNTYFYYIGGGFNDFVGLGVDRMVAYYKKFGLGGQVGIDLPLEADGFLPSKKWKQEVKDERWYVGDTYHVAIGQGDLLVTPLQVAYFTNFFANGGKLYRPHLVKQILTEDDKVFLDTDITPVRQDLFDQHNIDVVREGMRMTVTSGSARSMNMLPVEAAGKTGTAQWSSKKDPHAWFTGFAPYNNPEITITILVEEGKEGSGVTVAVAREFMQWYFTRGQAVEH